MVTAVATHRAVGYFRVSTSRQAGERHSSLDTQEAHYREYCQRCGHTTIDTFTDIVTGRRDDRKDYRRMVDFVLAGGADVVVVQFLDRFGRNPREILRRYWELEEAGVKVVAADEDIHEELMLLLKAGMAGAESRRTSERVRANMGRAIAKGVQAGRPPYGLKPIRELKEGKVTLRWEVDPTEGPVVREMARLAIEENLGFKVIGDRLSAMGHQAHGGKPFASFTVQKILTNAAIMGTLTYGKRPRKGNPEVEKVVVPDFFPPILSQQEWQRLQERLNIRREAPRGQSHSSVYLLSGVARCGHCGGPMTGKVGYAHKGKQYRNYYCSRAMHSKVLCSVYNGHSAAKLEKAVLDYLGQFSTASIVKQYLVAADKKELERREVELKDVEKRLADYDSQFLKRLDDLLKRKVLSDAEFEKAHKSARDESAKLEARRAELKEWLDKEHDRLSLSERLPKSIASFMQSFQSMDVRQQKAQLQTILKSATIYNDGRIELEFRE